MAGKGDSLRAILYALGANFVIFVAKSIAALATGSGAMLAEAVHSLADCGNQGLLLLGMKRARLAASPDYPLGFGKEVYFWSFLVALLLFSVGGMFSLYEGIHKLQQPEPLQRWWWAVGVLVFAIGVEAISMRACMLEVNKARGARSLWRWFRESRQAELVVIFGEDLAALLGLVLALGAVVATVVTGNPLYDALGTLAIGALLIVIAVFIAVEVKALLIGQSIDPAARQALVDYLESHEEVGRVLNLITLQLGADVLVAIKAEMHGAQSAAQLIERVNRVEARLRARFPEIRWCFFEPDSVD